MKVELLNIYTNIEYVIIWKFYFFCKESVEDPLKGGSGATEVEKATDSKTQESNELEEGRVNSYFKRIESKLLYMILFWF